MNLYHYTYYLIMNLLIFFKRASPELFANLLLTFFLSTNIYVLFSFYSKLKYGYYVDLGKLIMIGIFISVFAFNQILLVNNDKYIEFQKRYCNKSKLKATLYNSIVFVYVILTIYTVSFIRNV